MRVLTSIKRQICLCVGITEMTHSGFTKHSWAGSLLISSRSVPPSLSLSLSHSLSLSLCVCVCACAHTGVCVHQSLNSSWLLVLTVSCQLCETDLLIGQVGGVWHTQTHRHTQTQDTSTHRKMWTASLRAEDAFWHEWTQIALGTTVSEGNSRQFVFQLQHYWLYQGKSVSNKYTPSSVPPHKPTDTHVRVHTHTYTKHALLLN